MELSITPALATAPRIASLAPEPTPVCNGLDIQNNMINRIDFFMTQVSKVLEYLQDNSNVSIDSRACIALLHKIGKLEYKITINSAVTDRIINQLPANFSNVNIGNALYGLQKLDGAAAATKRLVQALATKVAESKAELKAQHIGNALYGLQKLDGTNHTTKSLVQALAEIVANSKAELDAQAIGNALYGLQKLDGADAATKRLVQALAKKVAESKAELEAQHIGNALYGLQKLDGTDDTTKSLVQALA